MKHLKTYNESVKDYLKSKSNDDVLNSLKKLTPDDILKRSIEFNFLSGFEYLIDNNLVHDETKYLIEKFIFNKHQDVMKEYESWFIEQLKKLTIYKSKQSEDFLLYKKDDVVLLNYDKKNHTLYFNYNTVYLIFRKKFNLNEQQINIVIKSLVKKYLKIKIDRIYNIILIDI